MNITSIRVGKTFNTGNYTSHKVEIEAIPDNGQSFEDAMAELNAIVDAQGPQDNSKGATTKKEPPAKKAPAAASSSDPPLAKKSAPSTTTATGNGSKNTTTTPSAEPAEKLPVNAADPPFEPGSTVVAEPAKKRTTRKKAPVPDHEKELTYVLDSETVAELAERFANLRTMAPAFGHVDNWEGALAQVAARYRQFDKHLADPDVINQITAAFKAERTAIQEQRAAAEGAERAA